jgi:hypothetical protein
MIALRVSPNVSRALIKRPRSTHLDYPTPSPFDADLVERKVSFSLAITDPRIGRSRSILFAGDVCIGLKDLGHVRPSVDQVSSPHTARTSEDY